MRVELTQDMITKGLRCPEGKKKVELTDSSGAGAVPGLFIEVRDGAKDHSFWLRYKVAGATKYQRLGTTGDLTLAEARKAAKQLRAKIVLGANPRAEANAKKSVPTFSEFFEEKYLPYVKPRKRSWARDENLYRPRLRDAFGSTPMDRITRHDIQLFHTKVLNEGLKPATANHYVRLIKHCFYLALDWNVGVEKNPATRIPLFHEDNKVERYLNDEELARLLKSLKSDPNVAVARIALAALATGCRLNELLSAKWSAIDLDRRVFTIQATQSKSRKFRSVPLNDAAVDILLTIRAEGKPGDYVFLNPKTGKPFTHIGWSWVRMRERAGFPNLRMHDLRHQFASMLVNAGRSLLDVQFLLGHADPRVSLRYAHLSQKTLREASSAVSATLKRTEASEQG